MTDANAQITPDRFFNEVVSWCAWIEESKAFSQKSLDIAKTKPEGAEHDPNLYMDEEGRVWVMHGETWYELTRSSSVPFAEYEMKTLCFKRGTSSMEVVEESSVHSALKPDGTRLVFVKRSFEEHMAEDWGWQVKNSRSGHPLRSTASYRESDIADCERGLQLAKVFLEQRVEIEAWMMSYAKNQGELRAQCCFSDNSWDNLLERFAPGFKGMHIPDNGSLLCELDMVLDQIALGRQIRSYFC